ncbi:hypothetical protein KDL01_07100 [Actinospica durhamensis]|uniref:Mannosyltransferase PIG-V n=1 Tax=Actinospica durhamensis TaxID=1508375 RepID=A0A941IQK3_9ACTN|nr:hypothetical protein [Actinospica durhamensis]MBR7833023.1 hypothetical protein [Actinospica durhamensis]
MSTVGEQVRGTSEVDDATGGASEQESAASVPSPAPRVRAERPLWLTALLVTLPAWLAAHALVLLMQDYAVRRDPPFAAQMPNQPVIHHLFNQLFTWDTAWYAGIAAHGYSGVASDGIRFWPLLPLTIRSLDLVGIGALTAELVVCWLASLAFGMFMYRVALAVGADRGTARRAVWLSQLAPGAFVLVMGYTEALAGMLAAAFLAAIVLVRPGTLPTARATWTWYAVGFAAGFGSGLVRPTGWLLCLAGLIEVVRARRDRPSGTAARLVLAASPVLGLLTFLGWVQSEYHDWMLPYSTQQAANLRGTTAQSPWPSAVDSLNQGGNGAGAFTVILVVASIGLLWGCVRRLPASYTAWAFVSLAAVITAPHFSSFARYSSGILPLLLVAAMLTTRRSAWLWTIGSSAALCAYFAFQSFIGIYIP